MACIGKINFMAEDGSFQEIEVKLPTSDHNEVTTEMILNEFIKNEDNLNMFFNNMNKDNSSKTGSINLNYLYSLEDKNVLGTHTESQIVDLVNSKAFSFSKPIFDTVNTKDHIILYNDSNTSDYSFGIKNSLSFNPDGSKTYFIANDYYSASNLLLGLSLQKESNTEFVQNINNSLTNIFKQKDILSKFRSRRVNKIMKDLLSSPQDKAFNKFVEYMLFDTQMNHEVAVNMPDLYSEFVKLMNEYRKHIKARILKDIRIGKNNSDSNTPNLYDNIKDVAIVDGNHVVIDLNKLNKLDSFTKYDFSKDSDVSEAIININNSDFYLNEKRITLRLDYRTKDKAYLDMSLSTKPQEMFEYIVNSDVIINNNKPIEEFRGKHIYKTENGYVFSNYILKDFNNFKGDTYDSLQSVKEAINSKDRSSNLSNSDLSSQIKFKLTDYNIKNEDSNFHIPQIEKDIKIAVYSPNNNISNGDVISIKPIGIKGLNDSVKSKIDDLFNLNLSFNTVQKDIEKVANFFNIGEIDYSLLYNISEDIKKFIETKDDYVVLLSQFTADYVNNGNKITLEHLSELLKEYIDLRVNPQYFRLIPQGKYIMLEPLVDKDVSNLKPDLKRYYNFRRVNNELVDLLNNMGVKTSLFNEEDIKNIELHTHRYAKIKSAFVFGRENILNSDHLNDKTNISELMPVIINSALNDSEINTMVEGLNTNKSYTKYVNREYNGIDNIDSKIMFLAEILETPDSIVSINNAFPNIDLRVKLSETITRILDLGNQVDINDVLYLNIPDVLLKANSNMLTEAEFIRAFDSDVNYYSPELKNMAKDFLEVYGVKKC